MSRLRRLVLSDRFFFLGCRVLPTRQKLTEHEFALLARVMGERRQEHGFLLTAWVFLPDPWHAILYPQFPHTISRVWEAIKVGATCRTRGKPGKTGDRSGTGTFNWFLPSPQVMIMDSSKRRTCPRFSQRSTCLIGLLKMSVKR